LPLNYPGQTDVFYWGVGAASAMMLFISVLIHEVAHSVVAQRYKIPVNSITLYFLGGVSEIAEEAHEPEAELRMAAAGPISSVVLGIVFTAVQIYFGRILPLAVSAVVLYAGYINITLALFNLIPAFPMDGGRVLRGIIWGNNRDVLKATRIVTGVSRLISFAFIGLGLTQILFYTDFSSIWLLFIGLFINSSAQASMNETRISQALTGVTVGEIMTHDVKTVDPDMTLQQVQDYALTPLKHHGFPVMKGGELFGIITDEDLRGVKPELWDEKKVSDIMKRTDVLIWARPEDAAVDAFIKMAKAGVGRLPVVDGGKLVGIITRSDFARVIQEKLQFRS